MMGTRYVERNISDAINRMQSYERHQQKLMEIRYVVNRKKKLGGGTNSNIVNTIDEELIENIQYNRSKANEFHEGEKNSAIKK